MNWIKAIFILLIILFVPGAILIVLLSVGLEIANILLPIVVLAIALLGVLYLLRNKINIWEEKRHNNFRDKMYRSSTTEESLLKTYKELLPRLENKGFDPLLACKLEQLCLFNQVGDNKLKIRELVESSEEFQFTLNNDLYWKMLTAVQEIHMEIAKEHGEKLRQQRENNMGS